MKPAHKQLNKGYHKETLINYGYNENSSVIESNINIRDSTFENNLDFSNVLFNCSAYFKSATFNNSANFVGATFNDSTDFDGATFNNSAYFDEITFNNSAYFGVPEAFENIFTDGKTCRVFMDCYRNKARYTDADNIYYDYRKFSQEKKNFTSISKWPDILSWVTCGYGVRLTHTFYCSIFLVFVFAIMYRNPSVFYIKNVNKKPPRIYRPSEKTDKNSTLSFWDALYFSAMIFSTVGSGEWSPRNDYRKWVTLEGLLGWIMLGIFMTTLTNVMVRP